MISQKLLFARSYESEAGRKIPSGSRPMFHLSPYLGWMNDPNGFSYYQGQYHLFYQYNPYDTVWASMHWGHAVSRDLLRWEYLPAALAPDKQYDSYGCFSGSAMEMPDGKHLLLYTGMEKEAGDNGREFQTQCVAIGDGLDYKKYPGNPVIDGAFLPEGMVTNHFRDPKIWLDQDGRYYCVVGGRKEDSRGAILLYSSPDGIQWEFESVLVENDGSHGLMWECPDFFELDGEHVLLCSPQDMLPEGFEYHNGNGTLCLIGKYDRQEKRFHPEHHQSIDYGIDFYASQTLLTPDGRRVMIGWMQNWDTCPLIPVKEQQWFGQMSLPRELSIRDGRLYQQPVRELDAHRSGRVEYRNVDLDGELTLSGVEGRTVDLTITLRPGDKENLYHKFAVRFAQNEQFRTALSFRPYESVLKVDRKFSGSRRAYIHQRRCLVPDGESGEIKLRIILDRFSAEVFINDGRQVMTATVLTDPSAKGISFFSKGKVKMDVEKYDLIFDREENHAE